MENGPVIALFMGPGKGGAGVSTLAANVAWLVSQRLPIGEYVGLVDASIGANATVSRLFGLGFNEGGRCVSNGLWEYILDTSGRRVKLSYKPVDKLLIVTPGCMSSVEVGWGLGELLSIFNNNPDAVARYVQGKLVNLTIGLGARITVIDLPSSVSRPIAWPFLGISDVVVVVGKWGTLHAPEVNETLSMIEDYRQFEGRGVITIVVENLINPKADDVDEMRRYIRHGFDRYIQLKRSDVVDLLTSKYRDIAVRYSGDPQARREGEFREWVDGVGAIADVVTELARRRWG